MTPHKIYVAALFYCGLFMACSSSMNTPMDETPDMEASTTQPGNTITMGYSTWDADGANGISSTEFNNGFLSDSIYTRWDADGDGYITPNEYHSGVYTRWDRDGNGTISTDEWNSRNNVWDTQGDQNLNMNGWTGNSNTDMTREQFNTNFGTNSNFRTWDANLDNRLDQDELNNGTYRTLDRNRDGRVDDTEFGGYYLSPSGGAGNTPNKTNINPGSTPNNSPGSSNPSGASPSSVPSGSGTAPNSNP